MREHWQPAFLAALEKSGSVTTAAQAAGISRVTAYKNKRGDPEFAKLWEEALDCGADTLEDEARKRAMDSTTQGSHVLLMFLLKVSDRNAGVSRGRTFHRLN